MFDKLNNLEQSNHEIMKCSQQMSFVQTKIDKVEQQTVNHEQFLKVLAYKSIDMEARSRRCNLVVHGLAECKNEHLHEILQDFLWDELGIDSDDLLINRFHRLGSLYKAKTRQSTDTPRRPVIIAFQDHRDIERILQAAYMLKGSRFSISRDFPKEIVAARQRLMPRYRAERINRNNKVSIEYPAKLVVNGRVVADEFPDWFQVLGYDRYQLACGNYSTPQARPQHSSQTVVQSSSQGVPRGADSVGPQTPVRSYAQVVSSVAQQQQQHQYQQLMSDRVPTSTQSNSVNAPAIVRPANRVVNTGNQVSQAADTTCTTITTNTIASTNPNTHSHLSMNLGGVNSGTRDIPTYTNL